MMQGLIERQTVQEMKQTIDNYVKFISKIVASDPELKKKRTKVRAANP